jgi:cell division protein FtsQ
MWFANVITALAVIMLLYASIFVLVHLPVFAVRQIDVKGDLKHITREQIAYIIKNDLKGTFFTLNIDKTRQSFEKLPWVREVSLRRVWPDKIEIRIEEHAALGRWGTDSLVSVLGERFDAASSDNLPVFVAPDGSEKELVAGYTHALKTLAPLGLKPVEVSVSARRAWRIKLDNEMTIELGRDQIQERLNRFVAAYPDSLASTASKVDYVDLRYPNGFAVRLPEGVTVKPLKKPGAEKPKTTNAAADKAKADKAKTTATTAKKSVPATAPAEKPMPVAPVKKVTPAVKPAAVAA